MANALLRPFFLKVARGPTVFDRVSDQTKPAPRLIHEMWWAQRLASVMSSCEKGLLSP